MKAIMIAALALFSTIAQAWQFEASFGKTYYTGSSMAGGDWRQPGPTSQGFYDDFSGVEQNTWTLGIVENIAPTWKARAGYADLGKMTSFATATAADAWFDFDANQCAQYCGYLASWFGKSHVRGYYMTAVKEFNVGKWKPFLEAGGWFYKNEFSMSAYTPSYADGIVAGMYHTPIKNGWRLGPVFGFGVGRDNASLAVTFYDIRHKGFVSINDGKSYAANLSLRVRFWE